MTGFVHSPIDIIVLAMLLVVGICVLTGMIRAHRPWPATAGVAIVYGVFLGYEALSAPSGNTISETVIELWGPRAVQVATAVIAAILILHWEDLGRHLRRRPK